MRGDGTLNGVNLVNGVGGGQRSTWSSFFPTGHTSVSHWVLCRHSVLAVPRLNPGFSLYLRALSK